MLQQYETGYVNKLMATKETFRLCSLMTQRQHSSSNYLTFTSERVTGVPHAQYI